MKILAIETSCDETAIAILECDGDEQSATFKVLSHALLSQIEIHREFGGVFPAVAKREHAKNLVPLLYSALEEAEMLHEDSQIFPPDMYVKVGDFLFREEGLTEHFVHFIEGVERPPIDAIAVTYGPGLAPALWVGVNFAQALSLAWNIPLVPVNHMEGHFMIALAKRDVEENLLSIENVQTPILGLLISGGHTELDLMENWLSYRLLGQTRDDAVGEAFDKVGRMLDLPYPGGPEVSKLAERDREDSSTNSFKLPRPMIDSPDYYFSFSGLKTAVLYTLKNLLKEKTLVSEREKEQLARAFEDAAADVLIAKTVKALEETRAQTLAIGGGVSANIHIRRRFEEKLKNDLPYIDLRYPPDGLTGDNAIMIGLAGFYRFLHTEFVEAGTLMADGNLSLAAPLPQRAK
ncbi:tRNA (adenosine(37)-N6)-threonylcarbamoyltransferase complex transferase subunit TsaD [Patescibacteria group bacterium]|nr:tRNA (adenosine(37)-N6)-threonylcarbamoyltransferase complex transferase subunit TsaD [Patescibacteria group bacterium]